MIQITRKIILNDNEISEDFVKASGPGGQNVNKVSTAVQIRFNVKTSPSLPENVRKRLLELSANSINDVGELLIHAKRFRTQIKNRQDAVNRLAALIRQATITPKTRKKTVPSKASKKRRLEKKRFQGERKSRRGKISYSGDD